MQKKKKDLLNKKENELKGAKQREGTKEEETSSSDVEDMLDDISEESRFEYEEFE